MPQKKIDVSDEDWRKKEREEEEEEHCTIHDTKAGYSLFINSVFPAHSKSEVINKKRSVRLLSLNIKLKIQSIYTTNNILGFKAALKQDRATSHV